MGRPKDDELSGPAVQKREVMLVVGLIAAWLIVVYVLIHTSKEKPRFSLADKPRFRVEKKELAPTVLDHLETHERMDVGVVEGILKSMRDQSNEKPDFFGTLITAEPAPPPMVNGGVSYMPEEVIRGANENNAPAEEGVEQEGEVLEPEPPETVEPPPTATEPTKL